ncbi:hypothetical protein HRR83_000740 [Exophiala dermatitidis]|uniref:SH3 domain-containing protein n=1 Tax=Exophiala dermatitidis TaxID=5970 RepID=A0AAN6F1Y1_EXODE|nr:hypothetical protein HRR74_000744 [Exophiala dermatitidis]KAJ4528622.1 hypothetical protein HRR73_001245 [Exophiala dermatitidis]KAJ4529997.1 hypothetical protein HRR76_009241 [Exophiala dermatitidis]KAJ4558760.1 hypothetical protein HRR77_000742 [Exophiala dermatitidis]KAJ4581212.1 hypothetical protein HRR79_000258 [Exophiala dermatitidis]
MVHGHGNYHEKMADLAKRQVGFSTVGGTVYSVVYVTAQPTFTGVIGGYTTLTSASAKSASAEATSPTLEFSTAPTETVVAQDSSTAAASSILAATTSVVASPTTANNVSSGSITEQSVAPASATATSSDNSSSSSRGMSTGAKAGIAIGVIGALGLFAVFLLWLLGKKRRARESQANKDNEKSTYANGPTATELVDRSPTVSSPAAPRLSLRPVSRMLPEFMGSGSKSRMSGGNLLNTIGETGAVTSRNPSPSPQPRGPSPTPKRAEVQNLSNPFADPQNPFADPEKSIQPPAPVAVAPTAPKPLSAIPAPNAKPASEPQSGHVPDSPAVDIPAPAPAAVTAPEPAKNTMAVPAPEQTSSAGLSTPVSAAPSPAAASGPEPPQGNVFRVLMDFKPSMDDELELKNGQLVRMLHEYDDGWALCIRLDRSQQGVVPRTCLAAKPSKPKPSHLNQYARPQPGQGPTSRPMSPAGGPPGRVVPNFNSPRPGIPPQRPMSPASRPMSPAGTPRPMSPAGSRRAMSPVGRPMSPGHFNQAPRPLSPGPLPRSKRSMSPDPYGGRGPAPMAVVNRRRSNSASNFRDRRNSPVGPSKLGPGTGIAL